MVWPTDEACSVNSEKLRALLVPKGKGYKITSGPAADAKQWNVQATVQKFSTFVKLVPWPSGKVFKLLIHARRSA